MLARLAARLLLAPLGLVCGILAGFATLAFLTAKDFAALSDFPGEVILLGYDMSLSTMTVAFLLGPLMGAPAMVGVAISEMFSIRTWPYHAMAGAIAAVLPWALTPAGYDGPLFDVGRVLAAGLVGGLTHWLIAGRSAGLKPDAPPPGA